MHRGLVVGGWVVGSFRVGRDRRFTLLEGGAPSGLLGVLRTMLMGPGGLWLVGKEEVVCVCVVIRFRIGNRS